MEKTNATLPILALSLSITGIITSGDRARPSEINDGIYNFESNMVGYDNLEGVDLQTASSYYDCPEGMEYICAFGTKVSGPVSAPINVELRTSLPYKKNLNKSNANEERK